MSGSQQQHRDTVWAPQPDEPVERGEQLREGIGERDEHPSERETYRRDNFWGDEEDERRETGHTELAGTDAAAYKAHQLILRVHDPLCGRSLDELDEPITLSEPYF